MDLIFITKAQNDIEVEFYQTQLKYFYIFWKKMNCNFLMPFIYLLKPYKLRSCHVNTNWLFEFFYHIDKWERKWFTI